MNERINILDFIDSIAEKHQLDKKETETFVKEFFSLIEEALEKDKYVKVKGLGTFKLIEVDSRESVNVNTGERFEIQGHTKVSFTPDAALKEVVNRPFSHFEPVVLKDNVSFDDIPTDNETESADDSEIKVEMSVQQLQEEKKEEIIQKEDVESSTTEGVIETDSSIQSNDDIENKADQNEIAVVEEEHSLDVSVADPVKKDLKEIKEQPLEQYSDSPNKYKYFTFTIFMLFFMCVIGVLYMYWDAIFPMNENKTYTSKTEILESNQDTVLLEIKDTVTIMEPDTVATESVPQKPSDQISKTETQELKKEVKAKPFTPDSIGYVIVGTETTHIIKAGETLTRVALKYYGTKALWPYIVKHNPTVITNPDNVPFGTKVQIPKLKKKQ